MTTIAVLTTTDSVDEARRISAALIEKKLAACAQISEIDSVFEWRGGIKHETEYRVFVKTTADRYDAVEKAISERHSYELPAIYAIELSRVLPAYAEWVAEQACGEAC